MSKPIDVLMEEHRLIEQVLGSLESCAVAIDGGLAVERPLVKEYGDFFRGFADAYHHGKEEDILFQRMIERGFPTDIGAAGGDAPRAHRGSGPGGGPQGGGRRRGSCRGHRAAGAC